MGSQHKMTMTLYLYQILALTFYISFDFTSKLNEEIALSHKCIYYIMHLSGVMIILRSEDVHISQMALMFIIETKDDADVCVCGVVILCMTQCVCS